MSNFLLWQGAYSELVFIEENWPDFGEDDLPPGARRVLFAQAPLWRYRGEEPVSQPEAPRPQFNPLARRSWTDLGPRVASGVVLIILAVGGLYLGTYVFAALVGAVFAGCYREWERMVTLRPLSTVGGVLIGLVALSALVLPAFGVLASAGVIAIAAAVAAFGSTRAPRLAHGRRGVLRRRDRGAAADPRRGLVAPRRVRRGLLGRHLPRRR